MATTVAPTTGRFCESRTTPLTLPVVVPCPKAREAGARRVMRARSAMALVCSRGATVSKRII
jgi:hypothetical protein